MPGTTSDAPARWFDWKIGLGSLINFVAVVGSALFVAGVLYASLSSTPQKLADLQTLMDRKFGELQQQVKDLPVQSLDIGYLKQQARDQAERMAQLEGRLTSLEIKAERARSDLDGIMRASNVPLPGARAR